MAIINMVYLAKEEGWWQPWANTLVYYDFDDTLNDGSWNNHPATVAQWSAVYITWIEWKAITCSWNVMKSWITTNNIIADWHTLSFRVKLTALASWWDYRVMWGLGVSSWIFHINIGNWAWWWTWVCLWTNIWGDDNQNRRTFTYNFNTTDRFNVVFTFDNWNIKCYINKTLIDTQTLQTTWSWDFYIGSNYQVNSGDRVNGYIDEFIVEDKIWSQTDVNDYYDGIIS